MYLLDPHYDFKFSGQAALDELAALQDNVKPFDTKIAVDLIEKELGQPLGAFFSEISERPVAAASLAQVYKAKLLTGETVAVKVQRPDVLQIVSKDLYVLRRAAQVYQGLMDRFAPQQKTNYVALFNEWAVGFYTELDFLNEAANMRKMRDLLAKQGATGVYIPEVFPAVSTRRVLVTEWIDGVKLSQCPPEEIREYIAVGQECFLMQLLQVPPHPPPRKPRRHSRLRLPTPTSHMLPSSSAPLYRVATSLSSPRRLQHTRI